MAKALLVLGLLSLALANPLAFHSEYLKKILPADTPLGAFEATYSCNEYICNTGTPFANSTCLVRDGNQIEI